ncbi:MAG: endonuclease, partial [Myxococcota bacterium]
LVAGCTGAKKKEETGVVKEDWDDEGDGEPAVPGGRQDCNDDNDTIFPGAPERCNGVDDDCDGQALWEEDLDCAPCEEAGWFADLVAYYDSETGMTAPPIDLGTPRCSYATSTKQLFLELDKRDGEVACVYTGQTVQVGSEKPDHTIMNTEHTWPRSEGAQADPQQCDLHHLYPTLSNANSKRGNLPFGEFSGSGEWSSGGSKSNGTVFEPRDDHKGNAARAVRYFALRYNYGLPSDQVQMFKEWERADPVTEADLARDATIARWQGLPNPYIACHVAADAF